jgi:hypothetical protein
VQVHYGEGVAIRPRAVRWHMRGRRRSVGRGTHRPPLSRENLSNPGADVFEITEGNMGERDIASVRLARRGRRPWHVWKFFAREPGGLGLGPRMDTAGPHRKNEES